MDDTRLVGEIMVAVEPFVVQPFGCAIGCRCNGAAPLRAADDLDREMENCHCGNPSTLQEPRRNAVEARPPRINYRTGLDDGSLSRQPYCPTEAILLS